MKEPNTLKQPPCGRCGSLRLLFQGYDLFDEPPLVRINFLCTSCFSKMYLDILGEIRPAPQGEADKTQETFEEFEN